MKSAVFIAEREAHNQHWKISAQHRHKFPLSKNSKGKWSWKGEDNNWLPLVISRKELQRTQMASYAFSLFKREEINSLWPGACLSQEWSVNGWAQATSIRWPRWRDKGFPRFFPQQTLGSFIHSRVFQVSLERGLIRRVIKSSKEWVHQWEQRGCQKQ